MLPFLDAGRQSSGEGRNHRLAGRARPALRGGGPVSLWPFDGALPSLLVPGNVVVAETYPAECYGWFDGVLDSKGNQDERKRFGVYLLHWADAQGVMLANCLTEEIQLKANS